MSIPSRETANLIGRCRAVVGKEDLKLRARQRLLLKSDEENTGLLDHIPHRRNDRYLQCFSAGIGQITGWTTH